MKYLRKLRLTLTFLLPVLFITNIPLAKAITISGFSGPIYSGDTVNLEITHDLLSYDYIEWGRLDVTADLGLMDTSQTISADILGLAGASYTVYESGGFQKIAGPAEYADIQISTWYGTPVFGADPSSVLGTLSFVAGGPGDYYFNVGFHVGGLIENTSFVDDDGNAWFQKSQLIYPPFSELTISILERPDIPAVPVPATVWLFGSGLLGLVGVARRKKAV